MALQLPAASAHYIFRAFRQVLEYAAAMGLSTATPPRGSGTPAPPSARRAIHPFETWQQVDAISAEMHPRFAAIPVMLVGTGLRPEELFALERRDLDLDDGVLSVERVYTQGVLKECRKSSRQRRRVPLRQRVVGRCGRSPPRIDTPLVFPAAKGGHVDLEKFRVTRVGTGAASGRDRAPPRLRLPSHVRDLGIAAACSSSTWPGSWARSVQQIDQTYGHLLPDSEEYLRGLLDAFDDVYGLSADSAGGQLDPQPVAKRDADERT